MAMRLRSFANYRYGYQGSEKESGVAGMYTTDFRMLDVRIGRWFMPDPIFDSGVSPYSSMDNNLSSGSFSVVGRSLKRDPSTLIKDNKPILSARLRPRCSSDMLFSLEIVSSHELFFHIFKR